MVDHEEGQEVFRGHLEECLKHLGVVLASKAPKGSKGAAKARKPIVDFCGVGDRSVLRWVQGGKGSLPVGEPLLKLMCYLNLQGYKVIEFERMNKGRRNFMELVGFGLMSVQQVIECLGYSSASTWYQVLQGNEGAGKDKDQKMWAAWKERREELEQKKRAAREIYRLDIPPRIQPTVQEVRPVARVAHAKPVPDFGAIVSIIEGLLALVEARLPGELSDEDLEHLRRSAGDTILRLSAHLSALSSKLIMHEQREGGA